jgi:tRNA pseudouridine38-40 synthase
MKQMNALCGPSIVVRDAQWTDPDFHARYSALWLAYQYTVLNSPVGNPFMTETAWHIIKPQKVRSMQLASDAIIGNHDFSAFCRKPKPADEFDTFEHSMRRSVMSADWKDMGDGVLRFDIRANAFCHQMVRSIVGTLVDVGLRKLTPGAMSGILRSGARTEAGQVAPAHGLCLWEVGYDQEVFLRPREIFG